MTLLTGYGKLFLFVGDGCEVIRGLVYLLDNSSVVAGSSLLEVFFLLNLWSLAMCHQMLWVFVNIRYIQPSRKF